MGIFNCINGSLLGALWGGPVGMVIGGSLGGALDGVVNYEKKMARDQVVADIQAEFRIALSVVAFLGEIAEADGHFCESEKKFVYEVFHEFLDKIDFDKKHLPPDSELRDQLHMLHYNRRLINEILDTCQENKGVREYLLMAAWELTTRDGYVSASEVEVLKNFAPMMGVSIPEFLYYSLAYYRVTEQKLDDLKKKALNILHLSYDATPSEIKQAYRNLSKKYHPDGFNDLPEAMKELANEKMKTLNEAYHSALDEPDTSDLYAMKKGGGSIFIPRQHDEIKCFNCSRKFRLVNYEKRVKARCDKCGALLLHEHDVAVHLLNFNLEY